MAADMRKPPPVTMCHKGACVITLRKSGSLASRAGERVFALVPAELF